MMHTPSSFLGLRLSLILRAADCLEWTVCHRDARVLEKIQNLFGIVHMHFGRVLDGASKLQRRHICGQHSLPALWASGLVLLVSSKLQVQAEGVSDAVLGDYFEERFHLI